MIPLTRLFKYWTYQVFSPGTVVREKYEAFKSLLRHDKRAHEVMADLEEIYQEEIKVDLKAIEQKYDELSSCVAGMVEDLSRMYPARYMALKDYFQKFDFYIKFMLSPPEFVSSPPFVLPLEGIPLDSQSSLGGKAYHLGEIKAKLGLRIPRGFVITTNAFYYLIEFNNLWEALNDRLSSVDLRSGQSLDTNSRELTEIIMNADIPPDIEEEVMQAFEADIGPGNERFGLAVRSSAVSEDSRSSFAGQYRTILNVGKDGLLDAYKKVLASKYEAKALYYRINYGLTDLETPMAVLVLEMIDAAASGVIYTKDLDFPNLDRMVLHSVWGLGELLVSGEASPDMLRVSKERTPRIMHRRVGDKESQMVFSEEGETRVVPVESEKRERQSIDDAVALTLADWAIKLEEYYGEPQDIEWAVDRSGEPYLLQSRSLRLEEAAAESVECNLDEIRNPVLLSGGEKASSGIGAGRVFNLEHVSDMEKVPEGSVLVARNTSPGYVRIMDKLNAVVTDIGSTAGHFSSVAREFGVPTLVNTAVATTELPHEKEVTLYAEKKLVYDGLVQSLLDSRCARRDPMHDSPFMERMKYIMGYISPLRLVEPQSASFVPEKVRSIHDIIRFTHEKAIQEMFQMGEKRGRKIGGSKKLESDIPMLFYVLDVGGGLREGVEESKTVSPDDVTSTPMKAVLKGLRHPDIHWGSFTHFNWEEYDRLIMSGAIVSSQSAMLGSYAVLAHDYTNLNLRFGYHFVILDSICDADPEGNYILIRFLGGGADIDKRSMRGEFLKGVLERLGFEVEKKADLIDAQLRGGEHAELQEKLDVTGRLLGATKLMDMYLDENTRVQQLIEQFMTGRYHFAPAAGE